MKYQFAKEKINYEDLSSGRVLHSAQGFTSFPVRLASEIFQRCTDALLQRGIEGPYTVYDPCCGGAYLLTVLGFLHGDCIGQIYASDVDVAVLKLAEQNLSLLQPRGLMERIEQIETMHRLYGKTSHLDALGSAKRLQQWVEKRNLIEYHCFVADISTGQAAADRALDGIHIVITDVPYGNMVHWKGSSSITTMLANLYPMLHESAIVAVVADKGQVLKNEQYRRVDYFRIGKRHIALFAP